MAEARKCDICGKVFSLTPFVKSNNSRKELSYHYIEFGIRCGSDNNGGKYLQIDTRDTCPECTKEFNDLYLKLSGEGEER